MSFTLEKEQALVEQVERDPDGHLLLGVEDLFRTDDKGRLLISRDGLRVFLHRHLYTRLVGELGPREYLLSDCEMFGCQNPRHFAKSSKPWRELGKCRNNHRYVAADILPTGRLRCHVCYEARKAAKRTGRPKVWEIEAARTHCPQNHEYTPENTYRYGSNRKCRTCSLIRSAGGDPADPQYATSRP